MAGTTTVAARLRETITGTVLERGDDGFDEAAAVVFDGETRTPAVIARPVDARESAEVVRAATETGTPLAVRSGGHAYARHGLVDDGIVLDLRSLDAVSIDAGSLVGMAQGGATAGAYTIAAGEHGLATGFGDTATVGLAGLALGGGIGFLSRRDGLTIDNLLSAEVVLADSSIVTASADEHPDLFWALRGGGGNFGVVTSLQLRLTATPVVTGGVLAFAADGDTVAALIAAAEAAPDELSAIVNVMKAPPAPFLPPETHGQPIVLALVCYSGEPSGADAALAPLRASGRVVADLVRSQPYPGLFAPTPEGPRVGVALRTGLADEFTAESGARAVELVGSAPTFGAVVNLRVMGGAIGRVSADATAFAHRDRAMLGTVVAIDSDPGRLESGNSWVDAAAQQLPFEPGGYVNFIAAAGAEARAAYPESTLERLTQVKSRYDPSNVFRSNLNIPVG